jgi:peptidoglycan/LPS O-acetylase OafA/YrhL
MPLFFMLSGFVLALSDGSTAYGRMPCCGELLPPGPHETPRRMDGWDFYRRRAARTLPLYWLANLMCVPLVYLSGNYLDPHYAPLAYVAATFNVSTWFMQPVLLNGPSWFVSTLWFYYWCFPALLPRLQVCALVPLGLAPHTHTRPTQSPKNRIQDLAPTLNERCGWVAGLQHG